jgi:predicted permease
VRKLPLKDAAVVLNSAVEAAAAARGIRTGRRSPLQLLLQATVLAPLAAGLAFTLVLRSQWPVPALAGEALSILASLHIPLALVVMGASVPQQRPEKRHAATIASVVGARLITGLSVAAVTLILTPQSLAHAIRACALVVCLLSPMPHEVP